jgi:hypothetical protein
MKRDEEFEKFRQEVKGGTSERLSLYLIDSIRALDQTSRRLTMVLILCTLILILLTALLLRH